MSCKRVDLGNGDFMIVCDRGTRTKRCSGCGAACAKWIFCDWKLTGAKAGKTCDRVVCFGCRTSVGENKDLCPVHARLWAKDPRNPKNKG